MAQWRYIRPLLAAPSPAPPASPCLAALRRTLVPGFFFGGKTATKTTAETEPAENGASTTKPRPTGKSLNTRGMRPLVSSWQKQRGLQSLVSSQNNPKRLHFRAFKSRAGMHTSSKGSIITSQGARIWEPKGRTRGSIVRRRVMSSLGKRRGIGPPHCSFEKWVTGVPRTYCLSITSTSRPSVRPD